MITIKHNGKTVKVTNGNMTITGSGKVIVNGSTVLTGEPDDTGKVNITIRGDIDNLRIQSGAECHVHGSVGEVESNGGILHTNRINGDVLRNTGIINTANSEGGNISHNSGIVNQKNENNGVINY